MMVITMGNMRWWERALIVAALAAVLFIAFIIVSSFPVSR